MAAAAGHEPRPAFVDLVTGALTKEGSALTASMLRDIEGGALTEGEHVLGDMVERAKRMDVATPLLRLARFHVAAYEARAERGAGGAIAYCPPPAGRPRSRLPRLVQPHHQLAEVVPFQQADEGAGRLAQPLHHILPPGHPAGAIQPSISARNGG